MTNERPDLCAGCGECCLTRPGAEEPERFLRAPDPVAALASALASGNWVLARHVGVAWEDGAPPPVEERFRVIRYPRPATLRERASGAIDTGAEGSPCVFLAREGCSLRFDDRPRMCRDLEPWANGDCVAGWDLPHAARAWAPWQGLIDDAVRRNA
jgi:Fe-S-cluster containining protein